MDRDVKTWVRITFSIIFAAVFAFVSVRLLNHSPTYASNIGPGSSSFNFGYDFSNQEPDYSGSNAAADASALAVLAKTSGAIVDQSLYGFGVGANPEPSPGDYNTNDFTYPDNNRDHTLGSRITMITNAGDIPVISLVGVPSWMFGCATMSNGNCSTCYVSGDSGATTDCTKSPCEPSGDTWNGFYSPPCPEYYPQFAALAAEVASELPEVNYFIVWNEFKGFGNPNTGVDYTNYTKMYNDIYTAIKQVRPDAMIGGPYARMVASPLDGSSCTGLTLCDPDWGYVFQNQVQALQYWYANKVGADFVAVDGGTEIAKAEYTNITASPLDASEKYVAVDNWIKSLGSLPIWWMESAIQPCNTPDGSSCNPAIPCASNTCWTDPQAAASRIATLALMNASDASIGIWWQPQEEDGVADQGLWTSTLTAGGGQATTLDNYLNQAASILRQPLTLVSGEPVGVLLATAGQQALIVNTLASQQTASLNGNSILLSGGQMIVEQIPSQPSGGSGGAGSSSSGGSSSSKSSSGGSGSKSQTTAHQSSTTSSSSTSPVTTPVITLTPPNSSKPIKYVIYSIDKKQIAKLTAPPFRYDLQTSSLSVGCHILTSTTVFKNGTTSTNSRNLCVAAQPAQPLYTNTYFRIAVGLGVFLLAGLLTWHFFGIKRITALIHRLPLGHHLTQTPPKTPPTQPPFSSQPPGSMFTPSRHL